MKLATGILAALLLLSGCKGLPVVEETRISVRFKAGVLVKSLPDDEATIERLDLLVFRSLDGIIDTYASSSGSVLDGIEADVTAGCRLNWYLVANAPEGALSGITREEDFLSGNTLLSHTTASTLVMYGSGSGVFSAGAPPTMVQLRRYACKVSIGTLKVSYLEGMASTPQCVLETVALVNARGQIGWGGTPSDSPAGIWYNCSRVDMLEGTPASCLISHPNLSLGTAAADIGTVLYTMPNPSQSADYASSMPWTPRRTRLVLGLRIDGALQWYPVDLPAMQCNTHYRVENLIITGPGAEQPDGAIDRSSISFNVELRPWGSNISNVDFGTN